MFVDALSVHASPLRLRYYHSTFMETRAERLADRSAEVLRSDPIDSWLTERSLAVGRILVAICVLAVVQLGAAGTANAGQTATIVLVAYATFAAVVLLLLTQTRTARRRVVWAVHAADVGCAVALIAVAPAASGVFLALLLFPVLAAAYRWGFQEVVGTTLVLLALLGAAMAAVRNVTLDALALPMLLVAITGSVTGYLAEQARRSRFENSTVALALGRARLGGKFGDTVNAVLSSVREAFRATEVFVVLHEKNSGRVLVWSTGNPAESTRDPRPEQLPASHHDSYVFDAPGAAWHAAARWIGGGRRFDVVAVDESGNRLSPAQLTLTDTFLTAHRGRRYVGVPVQLDQDWFAQLLVVDPAMGVQREQAARFALRLSRELGPALYDHYVARQLRTHAQSLERRRIARELHDGVTQSLLGLEMEVVVLQRRAIAEAPQLVSDLTRVHGIVRDEVVTVRELMEGIRVGDVQSDEMLHHLTEVVDRFSRYTGIAARFVSDGQVAELSAYTRRQIARIVHEALVNVRKHSGADRVLVRADVDDGWWKLSIEDDGKGFPFAGRKTMDELAAQHQGPRTIAERVRIIGGDLVVESKPGFGARLEVSVPVVPMAT